MYHNTQLLIIIIIIIIIPYKGIITVGIATDYGLDGPESNPGEDEIFRPSRTALGPTQPPLKWVPGLSRGQSTAGACCWPLTPF